MIGILVVSHGRLGEEMVLAMEHIVGMQKGVDAVGIMPSDDIEEKRTEIVEKVERLNTGDGVAVLTDMFGGTPSNLAISVMKGHAVEVLAGLNLPMLIKLVRERDKPLKQAVIEAQESGRKYINLASALLG